MTYVFKPYIGSNQIHTDAPEWKIQFPVSDDEARKISERLDAWHSGTRPTIPDEMPKLLVVDKPRKVWPDAFMATDGLLVVHDAVRVIIEKLDPNRHQFFPLILRTKRGAKIDGPWFIMNVSEKQDSVVMSRSRIVRSANFPDKGNLLPDDIKNGEIIVDPTRQSNLNLWREARIKRSLLGSDTLVDELNRQGLKLFKKTIKATDLKELV